MSTTVEGPSVDPGLPSEASSSTGWESLDSLISEDSRASASRFRSSFRCLAWASALSRASSAPGPSSGEGFSSSSCPTAWGGKIQSPRSSRGAAPALRLSSVAAHRRGVARATGLPIDPASTTAITARLLAARRDRPSRLPYPACGTVWNSLASPNPFYTCRCLQERMCYRCVADHRSAVRTPIVSSRLA